MIEKQNLTPLAHSAQNTCFGCGPASTVGLHLEFFVTEDRRIVCETVVSSAYEGAPGWAHGGIIATMLDEVMSKANRANGHIAVTRKLEVEYLRPVPSGQPIRLEGQLERVDGRKLFLTGRILDARGSVLATGTAVFISVEGVHPSFLPKP